MTPRPIEILDARVSGMFDGGQRYANCPQLDLYIRENKPEFRFEQIERAFAAECDGFIIAHFHDGSDSNGGGYSGRSFPITMKDGTERVLRGPWYGSTDTDFLIERFGQMVEVHCTHSADFSGLFFGYWITLERAREACRLCVPVPGNAALGVVPVLTHRFVNFAVVKMPDQVWSWGSASPLLRTVEPEEQR